MSMLGVIPARGGSKGIKKKNIKLLCGSPLIRYTIESALLSRLDRVIVSTDCEEIAEISRSYGAEVLIRPSALADDSTPTLPVLQDVYKKLNVDYDAVMTLQPTSPFRDANHINGSMEAFYSVKNAESLVSVVNIPHNMSNEKSMVLRDGVLFGNQEVHRRQEITGLFARNGAIYITAHNCLNNFIFGGRIVPYIMDKVSSIDIDDMEDWMLSELVLKGMRHG